MYRTQIQKRRISVAFNCRDELARSIFDQSTMSPSQRRCRDTTTQIRRSYFFSWPPPFLPLVCTCFRVTKCAGKIKSVHVFLYRTILIIKFTCQSYRCSLSWEIFINKILCLEKILLQENILDFSWPTHPLCTNSKQKWSFSEPTHPVQWLRNIWMVPKWLQQVYFDWKILTFSKTFNENQDSKRHLLELSWPI